MLCGRINAYYEGRKFIMSLYEKLKGKKVDVNYETGYHFVIEYLSDNELEWEALADAAEGAPKKEKEPFSYYEIREGLYNINWIEESGLVVSQIADFTEGKVYAFMTWPDEKARGNRAELLHKGTLKVSE